MDKIKARYHKIYPHLVVCPNRIPFGQKDFSVMAKRLANHDVVIGSAIRDLASVRHFYNGKYSKDFEDEKNINTKEAEQIISEFNKSNVDQTNTKKTESPDKNKVKSKKISKK